jgi:hypothetical protein
MLACRLLLVASLLVAACGDSGPKQERQNPYPDFFPVGDLVPWGCSPASCAQGCCQGSVCTPGASTAACGYGGNPCSTCGPTQLCKDGTCQSSACDQTACPKGCCDTSGSCKPGTTDDACGGGGTTCKSCDSGASEVCLANKCAVKGSGSYSVTVVSATIINSWGGICGLESSCDPYVILAVGKTTGQSSIKADTNQPAWNNQLLNATAQEITTSFSIEVWDDDYGPDGKIAACSWKVTDADIAAGKVVQHCANPYDAADITVKDLTFTFQPL